MSGRIYDQPGLPICNKCKTVCLTSEENNFYGPYCNICKKFVTGDCEYSETHSLYIQYKEWLKQFQGKIVAFDDVSFKKFKKLNGITY